MKTTRLLYVFYFVLIAYLLINSGVFSDEFGAMISSKSGSFMDALTPSGNSYFVDTPVMHLTHYIAYRFFDIYSQFAVNVFKITYALLAFCLIAQFFKIYLNDRLALLVSFLFIFFPSHDSTVYFFMAQYLMLSFAFYLYAYYLAHNNKLVLAFLSALVGSFVSYGSTPIAISLFVLFILNKKFKKAAVMLVPNVLYSIYFISVTMLRNAGHPRILETVGASAVAKQFLLQVLTFIDSVIGPSMWLKIYYAFSQLSLPSLLVGIVLVAVCYKIITEGGTRYDPKLITVFVTLMVLSFLMFAVTGRYPQLCFNIGNRTTIYGTLLFAYLIVLMPGHAKARALIVSLLIFAILGISDHWKSWNAHQQKVILNIRDNRALKDYKDTRIVYVAGNQYSKYGPLSHVEFMSEGWVPSAIFRIVLERPAEAGTINSRFKYGDGYLTDTKYKTKTKVDGYINVYDSEKNKLLKIDAADINRYISSLPVDKRHWVQLIDNKHVKEVVLKLMPRLRYDIRI